jgi:hypothetical protein
MYGMSRSERLLDAARTTRKGLGADVEIDTEPRIFIEVERYVKGRLVTSRKEISFIEWTEARFPDALAASVINTALAEISDQRTEG